MSRVLIVIAIVVAVAALGGGLVFLTQSDPAASLVEAQAEDAVAPAAAAPSPAAPIPAAPAPAVAQSPTVAQNAAAPVSAATPAPAGGLPGGASSLTEQHGDWTVRCIVAETGRRCAFSQGLVSSQGGQRVLSLELTPAAAGGGLDGTLLTPFGLRFADGASLGLDDQPLAGPLPFAACIEMGCIVPVAFDGAAQSALRAGTTLNFRAIASSNGQPVELALSLNGFGAAVERTAALLR